MKKRVLSVVLVISMFLMLTMDGFASGGEYVDQSEHEEGYEIENLAEDTASEVNEPSDSGKCDNDVIQLEANSDLEEDAQYWNDLGIIEPEKLIADPVEADAGTSWETAMNINVNSQYVDSLSKDQDNYYKFVLAKPGQISLTFGHGYEDSAGRYWLVDIYNNNDHNTRLNRWEFMGNETVDITTNNSLGLPTGTYFVIVRPWSYSSEDYHFTINYEESDVWEKEPNNTTMTATPISVNTEIHGSLSYDSTDDYYSFELSDPGSIRISFDHDFVDSAGKYWILDLYNFNDLNTRLETHDFIGNDTVTRYTSYFGLPAGKFVLKIRSWSHSSNNYKFNINYTKSDYWEKEYNDNVANASVIVPNHDYYGSLQYSDDKDFFSFTISENDNVSIAFAHDTIESDATYWVYTVYNLADLNTEIKTERFIGNDPKTSTSSSMNLQPGTYIIKLTSWSYGGTKYKIKVNTTEEVVKVTGVKIDNNFASVNVGGYTQINATVLPENASNKAVTWKSSNTKVATVDSTGKVNGVKDGVANITVTTNDGNYTATAKITVGTGETGDPAEPGPEPGPETEYDTSDPDIELELADDGNYHYTLLLGEKYSINIEGLDKASVKPGDESIVKLADKKKGIVQAKKIGSTYAVCTVYGEVKIVQFKVVFPVICAEDGYMLVGENMPLSIKGTAIENVKWSVNGTNADISDDGILTANKPGTVQVTATIHKLNYKTKIIIESPKFAKSSYTVKAGAMAKIVLGGTKQGMRVKYTVEDENKAAILPDGRIAGLTPGITTLYATLGDKTFSTMIEVK